MSTSFLTVLCLFVTTVVWKLALGCEWWLFKEHGVPLYCLSTSFFNPPSPAAVVWYFPLHFGPKAIDKPRTFSPSWLSFWRGQTSGKRTILVSHVSLVTFLQQSSFAAVRGKMKSWITLPNGTTVIQTGRMSVFFMGLMPFGFFLGFFIAVCEKVELNPKRLLRGC